MLHIVQTKEGLERCRKVVAAGDTVVFLADAVVVHQEISDCQVYVHAEDLDRYNLNIVAGVEPCNMDDLVEYASEHTNSATWR